MEMSLKGLHKALAVLALPLAQEAYGRSGGAANTNLFHHFYLGYAWARDCRLSTIMGYGIIPFNCPLVTYLALPTKGQAHSEQLSTLILEFLLEMFFKQSLQPVHNSPLSPIEAFHFEAERSLHNICATAIIL